MSQLPPGHWESKEQPAGSGGKGEQRPKRQLPPGHWESKAQVLGSGGKGEQAPKRQLPPKHSESKLHLAGLAAVVPGRAWVPVAQPTRAALPQSAAISAPNRSCLISKPSHERPSASPEVTPGGTGARLRSATEQRGEGDRADGRLGDGRDRKAFRGGTGPAP